jgi:hypothetical protein
MATFFRRLMRSRHVAIMVAVVGVIGIGIAPPPSLVDAASRLPNTLTIDSLGLTLHYPDGWSVAPQQLANMWQLVNVPADQQDVRVATAWVNIGATPRVDHTESLRELRSVADQVSAPSAFLAIGGWPALQRRSLEVRSQPSKGRVNVDDKVLTVTTAVAAGNLLVRLEAQLPSNADATLIEEAEAIGQSVIFRIKGNPAKVQRELRVLENGGSLNYTPVPTPLASAATTPVRGPEDTQGALFMADNPPGLALRVMSGGNGEIEVAASSNSQTVVIARQGTTRTSTDGGQTFPAANNGGLTFNNFGDSSLGVGLSGNFYLSGIDKNPGTQVGCQDANGFGCGIGIDLSPNGLNFAFVTDAVVCPLGAGGCFPDQPHIAADRFNAGTGGDQVYAVWRNFNGPVASIVCSQNSGANWTAPVAVDAGGGDFPRVTVGQDGFVYVVYRQGGTIRINKYSSCRNGLTVQGTFPKNVVGVTDVTCPVPGLDRCNSGNQLSSHTVVVDDTNPNHIYVAYATNTAAGSNEDVIVADSVDGGATWPGARSVRVNTAVPARRFMPWVCATGGEAFVTWYDRRAATPCATPPCPGINNDLTDFFGGSASLDLGGNLIAGGEFKITSAADPQCASGWPQITRATTDSESCSIQPQLAGICCSAGGINNATGACNNPSSSVSCDFSDGCTAAGETCVPWPQGGAPKYGDYNGNACAAGRLFSSWASATPPPGVAPSGAIDVFFSGLLVGNVGQIQVPGSLAVGSACVGTTASGTLNVCNAGNADLHVNSIASSNSKFAVTTPTSGYPVTISPNFCFPFQVSFTPTDATPQTTTLTIASDDPAKPSATVTATGNGAQPQISVTGSTDFAAVCAGSQAEKTINVCNIGTACTLNVTSVAFNPACTDFTLVSNPFPAPVSHDSCLGVTIRFTPTSSGPKSCTLVIMSDDPASPTVTETVTANTPAASIDVPPDQGFLPEVIQTAGVCTTAEPFPISNTGQCNLNVTSVVIGGTNGSDFSLSGLPSSPIILQPGHVVGEGNLNTVFAPNAISRDRLATLTVTYESDPISHATTQVTRNLCGEGVLTGARVLVRAGGVPLATVEKIQLQRINGNRNKNQLDTQDVVQNAPLQTVTNAGTACAPFQFHREYGTVTNPIQLLAGSYQVTASAIVNGRRRNKTVGFDVNTCDFNPTVIIDF